MVAVASRVVKKHFHFVESSAYFVWKINLLRTVLFDFEKERTLKDSAFLLGSLPF